MARSGYLLLGNLMENNYGKTVENVASLRG